MTPLSSSPVDETLVASPREVRDLVQETRQEVASEVWTLRWRGRSGHSSVHGVYDARFGAMKAAAETHARWNGGECLTAVWMSHPGRDEWALSDGSWIVERFAVQRAGRPS